MEFQLKAKVRYEPPHDTRPPHPSRRREGLKKAAVSSCCLVRCAACCIAARAPPHALRDLRRDLRAQPFARLTATRLHLARPCPPPTLVAVVAGKRSGLHRGRTTHTAHCRDQPFNPRWSPCSVQAPASSPSTTTARPTIPAPPRIRTTTGARTPRSTVQLAVGETVILMPPPCLSKLKHQTKAQGGAIKMTELSPTARFRLGGL